MQFLGQFWAIFDNLYLFRNVEKLVLHCKCISFFFFFLIFLQLDALFISMLSICASLHEKTLLELASSQYRTNPAEDMRHVINHKLSHDRYEHAYHSVSNNFMIPTCLIFHLIALLCVSSQDLDADLLK